MPTVLNALLALFLAPNGQHGRHPAGSVARSATDRRGDSRVGAQRRPLSLAAVLCSVPDRVGKAKLPLARTCDEKAEMHTNERTTPSSKPVRLPNEAKLNAAAFRHLVSTPESR